MKEQQKHEMILEGTYPSGAQEWYCPQCDRRLFVMSWHPDAKQIIINLGDERSHSTIELMSSPDTLISYRISADDEARLDIWNAWLDKVDFDGWWNDPKD